MTSREGFQAFYVRVFDPLVSSLWTYCGDRAVAEEFAQEALARVARDWEKVGDMNSPSGWTYRVAFNLANSYFRRRRIERRVVAEHEAATPTEVAAPAVADAVSVRQAVKRLPKRQREAVALYYFSDLPVAEVAEIMSARPNTVKSWLSRARNALKGELANGPAGPSREENADVG